jgi:hypothetical protein
MSTIPPNAFNPVEGPQTPSRPIIPTNQMPSINSVKMELEGNRQTIEEQELAKAAANSLVLGSQGGGASVSLMGASIFIK